MEEEIEECYRISMKELNDYFNGRRNISFEEHYAFLRYREENKKRVG